MYVYYVQYYFYSFEYKMTCSETCDRNKNMLFKINRYVDTESKEQNVTFWRVCYRVIFETIK